MANILCKKNLFLSTLFFAFFCSLFFIELTNSQSTISSYAIDDTPATEEEIKLIVEENLYKALIIVRDGVYSPSAEPLKYNDFIDLINLDLSELNLTDVSGLMVFQFDNLKNLDLSHNNISIIYGTEFYQIDSLELLDVSYNQITNINFGYLTSAKKIYAQNNKIINVNFGNLVENQELYLQNNKLFELDLSNIKNLEEESEGYINLINNNFININKLILPNIDAKYIDLFGNSISNANYEKNFYLPHKLNFITQELYSNIEIDEQTNLSIFPSYDEHNYKIKFTHYDLGISSFLQYGEPITLQTLGKYIVEIYDGDINISQIDELYSSYDIFVLKSAPTFKAYIDDIEISDIYKVNKPVTLKFNSNDTNYLIEYKVNNGQYKQGDELTITSSGIYKIIVRSNDNGTLSKELVINIRAEISNVNFWSIFIALISMTAIACFVLALTKWTKK